MSRTQNNAGVARRQGGQSMIEYTIICAVLAGLLFAPLPPSGQTICQQLTTAIHDFYSDLTLFLSLP
jgi:hypothetical protein